jgi:hypothetical protein
LVLRLAATRYSTRHALLGDATRQPEFVLFAEEPGLWAGLPAIGPRDGRLALISLLKLLMEDVVYDPPGYLWALTIAEVAAITAATCVVLYGGAVRAGLGRRRAGLLADGAAAVLGGWLVASAVIAGHGWYHTRLGHQVPWMPVAMAGFLGTLLALSRIPVVARALAAPGMASRLVLPHTWRVGGVIFLLYLALGHLPALFALPAGLGDIATGLAALLVVRRLAQGTGRRAGLWFNAFGLTDLVVAMTLGTLTAFGLLHITPSGAPILELPLALIPTVGVPLLFALHITSTVTLARAPWPASADLHDATFRPGTGLASGRGHQF